MFKKTILIVCCTVILTFNLSMSYAKATTAAGNFEEWAAAAYANVVTGTMTIGAGAMHAEQYLKDNVDQMYNTAKETWPKMSADMKANFLSSLEQAGDGVVALGDWITAGLDALGNVFKSDASDIGGSFKANYTHSWLATFTLSNGFLFRINDGNGNSITFNRTKTDYVIVMLGGINAGHVSGQDKVDQLFNDLKGVNGLAGLVNALGYAGLSVTIIKGDAVINPDGDAIYNQLDNWVRSHANTDHPEGRLGVYAPTEAWTTSGVRLGLSTDGQTLLTLPDGVPYDRTLHGDYSWRKPATAVIDGVGAVLNPTTWDWVNARDKTAIRPATIPEIAEYVGVDEATAEKIKGETKPETKPGDGTLKNPTKKLVWTPLMMAGNAMTTKFPFSLPWDLIKQLKIFDVSPQAPKIEVNVPDYLQIDGLSIPFAFTLDLSMFDKVAAMVRWFNIIIWDIALVLVLRKLLPE